MNRYFVLAVMAALVTGCAAESFGEEPTETPGTEAEAEPEPELRVLNAQLQRPAEPVGTVDRASTKLQAAKIINYYESIEQSDVEAGGNYARSTK